MIPFAGMLIKALAGGLLKTGGDIIDDLHTSEEEKLQAKQKLADGIGGLIATLEDGVAAEAAAKERVLVAELQQGDTFTKRARPGVVWGGLAFIGINYVVFPVMARVMGVMVAFAGGDVMTIQQTNALADLTEPLADLPTGFWTAWGGICATWVIGRSAERRGVQNKLIGLITGGATGSDTR